MILSYKNLVISLAVLSCSTEVLSFSETWETGSISTSVWETWGSPSPSISSTGYNSTYSFDNNGNSWCDSGAHTNQSFTLKNSTLSFNAIVPAAYSNYQDTSIGFTGNDYQAGSCPEGGLSYLIHIRIRGDGNRYWTTYNIPGESFEDNGDNQCHSYSIKIPESGYVEFYRDGVLRYTSSTSVDIDTYNSQRIFIGGRSKSTDPILVDDIEYASSLDQTSTSCTTDNSGLVSPSLNVHMPSLNYQSLTGNQNIWADFEFYGQGENGELLWKLKDFGVNQ